MKKIITAIFILILNFTIAQIKADIIFKNCNVVTLNNDQYLPNQTIVVLDGKIIAIENSKKSKLKAHKVIDLKGSFVMPSMADAHIHLPEKEEDLKPFLELNLINGVTKLRSMRGDWKHLDWKEKYNNGKSIYPKLYLSAPPITRNLEATPQQLDEFVKKSKESGFKFIKILSIKNKNTFVQIDSLCKKYKLPIGGHFPISQNTKHLTDIDFFNSNYTSIEHLGGLIEPNLLESRVASIKKNNIFICPTLSWYSIGSGQYSYEELQKLTGMEYVSNTKMQEWLEKTKQYREKLGAKAYKEEVESELKTLEEKYKVINRLQKEGVRMLLSPDASSKYMMPGCNMITEMELLRKANLSNSEILQMATINFANFFNENNGELSVGKEADFIVLESNPLVNLSALKNIKGVYFNSNYLSSEMLKKMKDNLISNSK